MSDLISREAILKHIKMMRQDAWIMDDMHRAAIIMTGMDLCEKVVRNQPSAQPESYKEKLKEIADALSERFAYMNTCLNERDIILGYLGVKRPSKIHCDTDCTNIKCESHRCNKELSSVQPEPLTDREQRIFLAAMSREERACKQVDVEYGDCRELYENSLVSICHEITRKVKGALWT